MTSSRGGHKAYLGVVSQPCLIYMVNPVHCFTRREDRILERLGAPS